jgi:hypothetical protein
MLSTIKIHIDIKDTFLRISQWAAVPLFPEAHESATSLQAAGRYEV